MLNDRAGSALPAAGSGRVARASAVSSQHQIVDARAGDQRFLGDLVALALADIGVQRGDDADRAFDAAAQMFAVAVMPLTPARRQRQAARARWLTLLNRLWAMDRLERIELQWPVRRQSSR